MPSTTNTTTQQGLATTTTGNANPNNNNKRILSDSTSTSTTPKHNQPLPQQEAEPRNRSLSSSIKLQLPSSLLRISVSRRDEDDDQDNEEQQYYQTSTNNNRVNNKQQQHHVVHPFGFHDQNKKKNEKLFTSVVPSSPSSPLALPNTTQGKKMHAFEGGLWTSNDFNQKQQQKQQKQYEEENDDDSSQKSIIPSQLLGLRSKTMTALIITFMLIIALCIIGLSISFDSSFKSVEEREAIDSILKLSKALQDDYTILANRLYEYAAWDDVYNVLQDESATDANNLLRSFFSCEYMDRVNLNFAMYYLPNGSFLTGIGCYNQSELTVFPTELTNLDSSFFEQVYTPTFRARTYMIPTFTVEDLLEQSGQTRSTSSQSTNILMVTVQPTQTTDNTVSNGLAIFASYITMKLLEEESKRVRLCGTFYNVNNSDDRAYLEEYLSPTNGQSLDNYIALQSSSMISPNDTWTFTTPFKMLAGSIKDSSKRKCVTDDGGQRISSFKILTDYKGMGRVVMRTDLPRDIYNLGWYSFLYTIIAFLVLIIILTLSILLFVEFVVLRRVIKIGHFVRNVTTESDMSKRIQKMGRDELGSLSQDINKMLKALEFSQEKLARDNTLMEKILERTALEEEKSRCVMNSITDFIVTVECSTGLFVSINSSFENKILKKKQTSDAKEVFDGHEIFEYLKEFSDLKELLEKLDRLAHTEESFETNVTSGLGSKYPVTINVNKTKMTLREGQVGEAFIVVMKNLSEQKDFKNLVQQEKLSQIQQITKFEKMMNDQDMRKRFRAFAEKEQSVENFLFLEDVEVYKSLPATKDRAILQEAITKKYLQQNSEFPLNMSQKVLETEYKKISSGYGQLSLFDRLETIVKGMILGDTFQRFIDHEQNDIKQ